MPMIVATIWYENKMTLRPVKTWIRAPLSWLWLSSVPEMATNDAQTIFKRATELASMASQVIMVRIRPWKFICGPGSVASSLPKRAWEPAKGSTAFSKASRPVRGALLELTSMGAALTFAFSRTSTPTANAFRTMFQANQYLIARIRSKN